MIEVRTNPLIDKVERVVALTGEERGALENVCRGAKRHVRGADLITEGETPLSVFLLLEGWAFRYKHLANGSRQIMAYLVPGDLCDIRVFLFDQMDHSIGLLSDAYVAKIPSSEMLNLLHEYPRIERALMWGTLVDEATLREWLLNVGQRDAIERLAHLFCELCVRLRAVNLVDDETQSFMMPLTQGELADTTGMTSVHVNRSLQRLRTEGLVTAKDGKLTILDFDKLAKLSGFDPTYLHVGSRPIEQEPRSRRTSH